MKNFLRFVFDGVRLLLGVFIFLSAFVAVLKKEDIEIIIILVIIAFLCFFNNKVFIKILNRHKKCQNYSFKGKNQIDKQSLSKYEGTGEIFSFEYFENNEYLTEKKVIVEYSYTLNNELYIKAYDIKSKGLKHFKFNRIFL